MDPEERKIAALIAAFEDEHERVRKALTDLDAATGRVESTLKSAAISAIKAAFNTAKTEAEDAAHAMSELQRFTLWRSAALHFTTALAAIVITLVAVWLCVPSVSEMNSLRAEKAQLQASIEELSKRGGKIVMNTCGGRLCIAANTDQGLSIVNWHNAWHVDGVPMVIPQGY
jgi:hypothetical protein